MTVSDWRTLSSAQADALYGRERTHWLDALGWDTAATWDTIEQARRSWGLPGFVCCDRAGAVLGWTFFLVRDDRLDVGAIVADDGEVTGQLVDALLDQAGRFDELNGLVCARAAALDETLRSRALSFEPHLYLVAQTAASVTTDRLPTTDYRLVSADEQWQARPWEATDTLAVSHLMREAYAGHGRLFAPHDDPLEWLDYVTQLVTFTGCGTFAPSLSRVVPGDGQLRAVSMVSALQQETAHLAQLAVAPASRGLGIARSLVSDALRQAGEAGYAQMSLITARSNAPARALYESLGFLERGRFVALGESAVSSKQSTANSEQSAVGSWQ